MINKIPTEPNIKDLLDMFKRDIFLSLNCHAIGKIQSFDSAKQTAKVTIEYKKTYSERDAQGIYREVSVSYPVLLDCPVIVMQGGGCGLTFPISTGDKCLILFNDRDIDNWYSGGQVVAPNTQRMHSMSDGIALVGLNSLQSSISGYDTTRARFYNGTTEVSVGPNLVKIANNLTTLKTVLNDLLDLLSTSFAASTQTPGNPINTAAATALTAYKAVVSGLLE